MAGGGSAVVMVGVMESVLYLTGVGVELEMRLKNESKNEHEKTTKDPGS